MAKQNDLHVDLENKVLRLAKYHHLMNEASILYEQNQSGIKNVDEINEVLFEATTLLKAVKHQDEAVVDSKIFNIGSSVLQSHAEAINPYLCAFDPEVYVECLISFLNKDATSASDRQNWRKLASHTAKCFSRTPPYRYMFGTFQLNDEDVATQKKARKPREKQEVQIKKRPENVKETEKQEEGIEETVLHVLKVLQGAWKRNKCRPVNFFELVINPNSFAASVENIFHISFLIRDGHADITLDENKLPVIAPTPKAVADRRSKDNSNTFQSIVCLDMDNWEKLKKAYDITQPMIKPRKK
ncbi:non-structural maintenance of chromosomes element 4 homolog A [Periplaneta americana]|uniref:non-structural maintenance of chromosomes element 4 homolog A n=1 Tax=Periplaneta americana TaxID=6978 RepID=UPI0037E82C67